MVYSFFNYLKEIFFSIGRTPAIAFGVKIEIVASQGNSLFLWSPAQIHQECTAHTSVEKRELREVLFLLDIVETGLRVDVVVWEERAGDVAVVRGEGAATDVLRGDGETDTGVVAPARPALPGLVLQLHHVLVGVVNRLNTALSVSVDWTHDRIITIDPNKSSN